MNFPHQFRAGAEAGDGATALNLVNDRDFDLIVLDVHPPDVSGLEGLPQDQGVCPGNRAGGTLLGLALISPAARFYRHSRACA